MPILSKKMANIPLSPTLPQLQQYQADICRERGWDQIDELETFLLFAEEVGELAKAIRNRRNLFQEAGKSRPSGELAEEFADVFSYLLDLSNRFDVDLEQAYRDKETKNAQRDWE
jgi:NTP pyrophosphatase (non-canonical NTP hydrolase)